VNECKPLIDGTSTSAERGEAVDRFHHDPGCRAALVSVTAGGVGLDLSCASVAGAYTRPLFGLT
jgi:SNF2 family DNA or RNA helicase